MELKYNSDVISEAGLILLIVPYGIEIDMSGENDGGCWDF